MLSPPTCCFSFNTLQSARVTLCSVTIGQIWIRYFIIHTVSLLRRRKQLLKRRRESTSGNIVKKYSFSRQGPVVNEHAQGKVEPKEILSDTGDIEHIGLGQGGKRGFAEIERTAVAPGFAGDRNRHTVGPADNWANRIYAALPIAKEAALRVCFFTYGHGTALHVQRDSIRFECAHRFQRAALRAPSRAAHML